MGGFAQVYCGSRLQTTLSRSSGQGRPGAVGGLPQRGVRAACSAVHPRASGGAGGGVCSDRRHTFMPCVLYLVEVGGLRVQSQEWGRGTA